MKLTPFRSVEHPARFRLEHRPKGLFKRLLLKQKTALRILDRNSEFLAVLILRHFSSEVIQLNGYFIQFPGTQQTHFCAGRSAVDNFGTQAINYQPSAILLVFIPVEKPTPLVGNTFDIEAFRCRAACFTDSYGQFTASLKDLREVYDSMSQPLLKFSTVFKGYGVLARTSFVQHRIFPFPAPQNFSTIWQMLSSLDDRSGSIVATSTVSTAPKLCS